MLATGLLFPLERLKTLLQLDFGSDSESAESRRKSGLRDVCISVLQQEGFGGLYRGCWPMLQTVGVSNFLYFLLFEGLKEPLAIAAGRPQGEIGPYETLLSSAIAGSLNMCLTEPLWRACIVVQDIAAGLSINNERREVQARRNSDVFVTVAQISEAEGSRSLWRGLGSSLWLVANPVIQFFVYDMLKSLRRRATDVSSLEAFCMGAVAKAVATVATFPLQVAQSRLRAARESGTCTDSRPPELQGMVPCLRAIFSESGLSGLFSGLLPKLLQTMTQAACMFAFYEKIHWSIRKFSKRTKLHLMAGK